VSASPPPPLAVAAAFAGFIAFIHPVAAAAAGAGCAATMGELRTLLADPAFPMLWLETAMDDGKPLVLTLLERDGALFMRFEKTSEGLWAEGASVVCRDGASYDIRFAEGKLRIGPAANLLIQYTLQNGGQFSFTRMDSRRMQISTSGWSGTFACGER